ncbi:unnamed protein product [Sympodiomycopsis kandeliae]
MTAAMHNVLEMFPHPPPSFQAVTRRSRSGSPLHQLRVLVVDDNVLNLSVLTRLLRKKFSHLLDGAPVAVDSALKALQLLRENVFDVILMDIQMPFLSGVDCTERIRAGQDGVLGANRHVTVIAVTTATGKEPEDLYHKTGFDGIIGKPVNFDVMQELLVPLSAAARDAAAQTRTVDIDGQQVIPAVPVTPLSGQRIFFLPSAHRNSPNAPDITLSADFEALLREQTRNSLKQFGAYAISRTGTVSGASDRRRLREYDNVPSDDDLSDQDKDQEASPLADAHHNAHLAVDSPSLGTADAPESVKADQKQSPATPQQRPDHRRQTSMTISQSGLHLQLQQEMHAARLCQSDGGVNDGEINTTDAPDTVRAGRSFGKGKTRPSLQIASRHSTPTVFTLEDWDSIWAAQPGNEDNLEQALDNIFDGFNMMSSLSPLASPSRRTSSLPPAVIAAINAGDAPQLQHHQRQQQQQDPARLRRPGARPRQSPQTPDRRRSSADQSTSSEVSDSNGSSSSRLGGHSSTDRSDSTLTETEEEFDSPLTSPETEYPPSCDNSGGAVMSDDFFCPHRLGGPCLEEDSSMMPGKRTHLDNVDGSSHEIYDFGGVSN